MSSTYQALLGRGFRGAAAMRLAKAKHTVSGLQKMSDAKLTALKLKEFEIKALRNSRPPIPAETIHQVLFKSRHVCCVCRDSSKEIILHHIEKWSVSRDHSAENLVVLCLDHHGDAHSKHELGRNLTPEALRDAKEAWEREVKGADTRLILELSAVDGVRWEYANIVRLFELAADMGVKFARMAHYRHCLTRGYIFPTGYLKSPTTWLRNRRDTYMYNFEGILLLTTYVEEVIRAALTGTNIVNVSDRMEPGFVQAILQPGMLVSFQGAHTFKAKNRTRTGEGQLTHVSRSANGVRFWYLIDKFEAMSSSSRGVHLCGRTTCFSIARVMHVEKEDGVVKVKCSSLVIGGGFDALKTREYWNGFHTRKRKDIIL